MSKRIPKEMWTGYNAYLHFAGNLEKAEKFYSIKKHNLKKGFYDGWNMKKVELNA